MSVMHAAPAAPITVTGGRLVTLDGRMLPFEGGTLDIVAVGGLARVVLRQRFTNPYAEPLRVTYQVPLPADSVVSGYSFELGDERIEGEVDRKRAARERFEEALVQGRTAALLEQDRSSLFTQEVGNLPPGETVDCELTLDQKLRWDTACGGWEWRFPTVVAPRFLSVAGQTADAGRVTVEVAESGTPARMNLSLSVGDARTGPVASPTHGLHVVEAATTEVGLHTQGGAALDRDIVVRWPVANPAAGVTLETARAASGKGPTDHACGLLTLVPPAHQNQSVKRDLIVLLDTSGSMGGRPLAQAQAVTCALINTLGPDDQLQLVEFSTRPRAWKRSPQSATPRTRQAAIQWVNKLRAGGGTWMKDGIIDALARLRGEAQRQVVLVTDGLIGFEQEIVREIMHRLPRGSRVHTLGIGSSVNRSLLGPAARAGGGIELIVGLDEDANEAAARLVAATDAPQVVDLEIYGTAVVEILSHRPPDLLAGRPVRLAARLRPQGGTLVVRGHTAQGPWHQTLTVPPTAEGAGLPAIVTLVGRERVEELELKAATGESVNDRIEALGLAYQISTRLTSWVAISHARTVDPTRPTRAERVPQALPHGMSAEGLGLRAPSTNEARSGRSLECFMSVVGGPPPAKKTGSAPPPPRSPMPVASSAPPDCTDSEDDFADDFDDEATASFNLSADESVGELQPAPKPEPLLAWLARVVLARADRLVLEATAPDRVRWPAGFASATLVLTNGRRIQVKVNTASTTAGGDVSAGATIRVVVTGSGIDALVGQISRLELWPAAGGPAVNLSL